MYDDCREQIDMIIQCVKSIFVFSLILLYALLGFGTFFYLKADGDEDTSLFSSVGKVAILMTGGFDFDDKSDYTDNFVSILVVYAVNILMFNLLVNILGER